MKTSTLSLISLLASCALARPRARILDEPDAAPIEQKHRITAVVGGSVECWEVDSLLPVSQQKNVPRSRYNDELDGVDLLTWPEPTVLWPPPTDSYAIHNNDPAVFFDPGAYLLNGGLITIGLPPPDSASTKDDDDDDGQFIFSAENGDNWFYFEDNSYNDVQCAKNVASPIKITTASAAGTTLVKFKYNKKPNHTVLHKGKCNFAGLKPVEETNTRWDKDTELARLFVQRP